ncbi:MAG: hypothetical protein HY707_07710 [Ignavibacteriae bacterium]|nr:hypothetical protein [Ignavibacteriota bacterium]
MKIKEEDMQSTWNVQQRTKSNLNSILVFAFIYLFLLPNVWAGGLRCSIGEVVISNLKIGQTYSLKSLANLPLSITNTDNKPVTVLVEPLIPSEGELRQGASPIPDLTWASARPDSFVLAPQQTKAVELILTIPDNEALFSRKFQVNFWSHTLAQVGNLLAYGLNSRVIFTIDQVREEPGVVPTGDLSITFLPAEITLNKIKPGHEYRVEDLLHRPLVIQNTSNKKLSVELQMLSPQESATTLPQGYADLLSSGVLKLSPTKFTLEPGEKKSISGTVLFPKGKPLNGKKFMCVISAEVVNLSVQTQIYSRIYAHVK